MNYITVNQDNYLLKIMFHDVFYIETDKTNPRVLKFITEHGIYRKYGRLKDFEIEACWIFTRCHRKFLVNLDKVVSIDRSNRRLIFNNIHINDITCSRRNIKKVEQIWSSM